MIPNRDFEKAFRLGLLEVHTSGGVALTNSANRPLPPAFWNM